MRISDWSSDVCSSDLGELRYTGEQVPPIAALAEGEARHWAVYISTMSKTMAPALRIGWLVAPAEVRRRCVGAKAADDMASSAWIQEVVAQYLANGRYQQPVPRLHRPDERRVGKEGVRTGRYRW